MVDSSSHAALPRVGIEISKTSLSGVVIGADDLVEKAVSVAIAGEDDPIVLIAGMVDQFKREFGDIGRIGVAIPGLVDRNSGHVAFSAIVPKHSDLDIANVIRAAAKVEVVVENDANAAAYGEYRSGAGRGCRDMFYATLGEGVGGALIFDGEVWHGASGFAGEFGYVPINSEGMRLEEVVSTENIVRRTRSRFHQDSTSSLGKLKAEDLHLDAIIAAANKNDDFAQMMLMRTGFYVGSAVATVINLLNIERIVVGGAIMQAKHLVLDSIVSRAKELSFAPSFRSTKIVEGELGANAAAIGAAFISGLTTDYLN